MRDHLILLGLCVGLSLAPLVAVVVEQPPAFDNVAAEAEIETRNTIGIAPWVLRGAFYAEGADWESARALLFGTNGGELRLDFEEPVEVAALIVQAVHDNQYVVEASRDGSSWEPVWEVPAVRDSGLRTREAVLPEVVRARHLRLRNQGAYVTAAALTALRVYSTLPEGWPRPPGTLSSPPLRFPWLSRSGVDVGKLILAIVGAALIAMLFVLERRERDGRLVHRLLVVVSLVAATGWWSFFQLTNDDYMRRYRNAWDVYNYYMGVKYAPELRYVNLYRCHMAADLEAGFRGLHSQRRYARDLESNEFISTRQLIAESERCRDLFTKERWAEFGQDQAYFRTKLAAPYWRALVLDHGYNPSPVWAVFALPLVNLAPISDAWFDVLISLDTFLLVLMWYVVWSTFGWRVTAMGLLFWGTNTLAGSYFTGGAFLRHGWLFASVVGICCLKQERRGLGAFLLVYAALVRVFPGMLVLGLALKGLADLVWRRSIIPSPHQRSLLIGGVSSLVVFVGLSVMVSGRLEVWGEFVDNTLKHRSTGQVQAVGVGALSMHVDRADLRVYERLPQEMLEESYDRPERRVIAPLLAILFLPLLVAAVSREDDWVAAVLGLTWLPFVTDVSNYYYVVLLVFSFLWVRKAITSLGFAAMTLICSALGVAYSYTELGLFTFGSLAVSLYFVWIAALFAFQKRPEVS